MHGYVSVGTVMTMEEFMIRNRIDQQPAPTMGSSSGSPSMNGEDSPPKTEKPTRVTHACSNCRSKRAKCDGQLPSCETCKRRRIICTYTNIDGRRRKGLNTIIENLEDKVTGLESLVVRLRYGTEADAKELLEALRNGNHDISDATSDTDMYLGRRPSDDSKLQLSSSHSTTPLTPNQPSTQVPIYDPSHLPPRDLIRACIDATHPWSSTMFAVFDEETANSILDRVYTRREDVDLASLSELCALAAIGSRYEVEGVSGDMANALFRTAYLNVAECIEIDRLRGMRVLLCLSMSQVMAMRHAARVTLASGLQIARWAQLHRCPDSEEWRPWKKVYRTLIFLECWLSTTTGYQFDLRDEEIEFTQAMATSQTVTPNEAAMENEIEAQMSNVGLLMVTILRDVYNSGPNTIFTQVEVHSKRLDGWLQSLPPLMQLSSLTAPDTEQYMEKHRMSLLLVHVMYLSTKILLFRRLLVSVAKYSLNGQWKLDGSPERAMQIQDECRLAAQTCIRLMDILGYTKNVSRRCWLCVEHNYGAAIVLLFDSSQRLLQGTTEGVQESLTALETSLGILDTSCPAFFVARKMMNALQPLYQQILYIFQNQQSRRSSKLSIDQGSTSTGSPNSICDQPTLQNELSTVGTATLELLANPFGNEFRNSPDIIPKTELESPQWWT